jgi:ABC-type sugar transport system substrate-binding protein
MSMRTSGALVACAAAIVGCVIAGCGGSSSSSSSGSSNNAASSSASTAGNALQGKSVADLNTIPNAFTTCFQKQYLPQLASDGAKTFALYGSFLPATVEQITQQAITRDADIAIYTAEQPVLDHNVLTTLARANKKVVLLEGSPPPGTNPQGSLALAYSSFGTQTAAELAKAMPNARVVGIVDGEPGNPENDNTVSALKSALAARGISVAGVIHGDFTATGGAKATQDMLQAHPNVQVIISEGDDMSLAAARVVKSEGRRVPIVDLYAFSQGALDAIKSGEMLFVLYQPVKSWGEQVVNVTRAVAAGQDPPPVTLDMKVVDKGTVGSVVAPC